MDLTNSFNGIIHKDPDKQQENLNQGDDTTHAPLSVAESKCDTDVDVIPPSQETSQAVPNLSSFVMQKAVKRASSLMAGVVRAYGQEPIVEGIVL